MIKYLEVHNAFCLSTYKLKNTHQNKTKTLRFKINKFHNFIPQVFIKCLQTNSGLHPIFYSYIIFNTDNTVISIYTIQQIICFPKLCGLNYFI